MFAHPDDIDFGAARTVARWTAARRGGDLLRGHRRRGRGLDDEPDREAVAQLRRQEQTQAAAVVGVTRLEFLGYPDCAVEPTLALRRDITRVIRTHRPHRLITMSPERQWVRIGRSHPDHLATGEAAMRAVFPDARTKFAHRELAEAGLAPWAVPQVWLMVGRDPNTRRHHRHARRQAGRPVVSSQPAPEQSELHRMVRDMMAANAVECALPEGRFAETFQRIDTA